MDNPESNEQQSRSVRWIVALIAVTVTAVSAVSIINTLKPKNEDIEWARPKISPIANRDKKKRPTERGPFRPVQVVPPMPAITNAKFINADRVNKQVTDQELVLGVVINKQARAYPINMLCGPQREIINDRLGNRAIAATW
jgi:hypothetical protein